MEPNAIKNVAKKMFGLVEEDYKICAYGTTIYELYDELKKDDDLSIIGLLIEKGIYVLNPGELSKTAFSQIYLVFDFEPHYQKYDDAKIKELLNYFNDETENGRLYINYPMFESAYFIDDFENPKLLFEKVDISDCRGEIFKKKVREISCFGEKNHLNFSFSNTLDIWRSIKWNYIKAINLIEEKELDYFKILEKQIESKNSDANNILVLSTFVLMIVDYNPKILHIIETIYGL